MEAELIVFIKITTSFRGSHLELILDAAVPLLLPFRTVLGLKYLLKRFMPIHCVVDMRPICFRWLLLHIANEIRQVVTKKRPRPCAKVGDCHSSTTRPFTSNRRSAKAFGHSVSPFAMMYVPLFMKYVPLSWVAQGLSLWMFWISLNRTMITAIWHSCRYMNEQGRKFMSNIHFLCWSERIALNQFHCPINNVR